MWKLTTKRYIAFLDIMGFSDYVYRNPHAAVVKRMSIFQKIISTNGTELKEIAKLISNKDEAIKTVSFSDSVLIISSDESTASLESILFCSQMILVASFLNKIPIKGAISYGDMTADFDNSLFVGKALIDAYNLGEQLNMYGIVLDNKIERKINNYKFDLSSYCVQSAIPMKSGLITHQAINWVNWMKSREKKDPKLTLESFFELVSGAPRKYIDNTLDFCKSAVKIEK